MLKKVHQVLQLILYFSLFSTSFLYSSTRYAHNPDSSYIPANNSNEVRYSKPNSEKEWNAHIYTQQDELIVTIKDDQNTKKTKKISELATTQSKSLRYEKIVAQDDNVKNGKSSEVSEERVENNDALDGEWNERYYKDTDQPKVITLATNKSEPTEITEAKDQAFIPITGMTALEFRENLVSYALRFNGYPYRRGGTTPKGFDCSGFVYYIYNHFNIPMPRASAKMVKLGRHVSKSELTKGDVLFFRGRNSRSNRIGHVAIVISEPGETPVRFIHASTYRTGVKISDIETGYYPQRYITARRYIEY